MSRRFCKSLLVHAAPLLLCAIAFTGPVQAKVLRINIPADPGQIDPITVSELYAGEILDNVYEGFTEVEPDGSVKKMLAESWEPLKDKPGFRFHLRQGVKFHSGRIFGAKDVKYTLETLLEPGSKGGLAAPYLNNVIGADDVKSGKTTDLAGVTIVDDHTVDIAFTKLDVLFPVYPIHFLDSGIVAEQGADWYNKVSAGTGPFLFKDWKRGVSVDLIANPNYWGGALRIDGVSFLIIPNGDTALAQYDAGELDFVDVDNASFRKVLRDERYKGQIQEVPRAQVQYFGLNQNLYAPFKDIRVRQAVSEAIDRNAMIKGLYGGAAFPANGFVTPGIPGYQAGLPNLKYDPDDAKKLMAEAGYPDGKGLPPVQITTTQPNKDEAAYFADQFHRVLGIPASVNIVERATFIHAMNAGTVAFFPWSWTADYPDALTYLGDMWYGSSPYNRPRWKNADYDKLIDEARAETDEAKRYDDYHRAEKILLADWGAIPLPTVAVIGLCKPNVKGAKVAPFGVANFRSVTIE
jgi:peptide/nickel transport system substrate-binding protein